VLFESDKASCAKKRDAKRPRKKGRVMDLLFGGPGVFLFIPKLPSLVFGQKFNGFLQICQ
jgi:hypothetical protein